MAKQDQGPEFPATVACPHGDSVSRLLRAWRERVDRRRIPELRVWGHRAGSRMSQADVARLTGVSEGWYRALETGAPREFSDAFLLRVAEALRLSETEKLTLFLGVSGRRPPVRGGCHGQATVDSATAALLEHQAPHPAYLSDAAWNIVAANTPMTRWFPFTREPQANLMRWALTSAEARTQVLDWEDTCARTYLPMLRVASHRDPRDARIRSLIEDILATNGTCRRIWAEQHAVVEHPGGHRLRLRLPFHDGAEIQVTSHVLVPAEHPDLRFVVVTAVA
ncbi:helix-turn-helix transcriptional regulator [Streptomyces sp. NPDC051173]|uniref:helix-turn-helix transcriptional regulator n=1 Tax=Streptomyces sp. NPDC051173 TaxID=3155164 RepID=UPI00344DB9C2